VVWSRSEAEEVFELVRHRDHMLHHPFDSFTSVETLLNTALRDPAVVAIKMTLYRIGHDSPLIDLLVQAADAGKQVAVLVELKARFDERNNIAWANRLEEAGVHVVYGLVNLKTHAKLCLIVRKEPDGIRRYAHVGTGNYNASTARVYTDIGLVTARPEVVEDVANVFNYLTGYSSKADYDALLVAPVRLRGRLCELIDREAAHARAGRDARIIIKINGLTDTEIIRHLYRASQAGVRIDLIVRGICCLRPGVPGSATGSRAFDRRPVPRALTDLLVRERGAPEAFIGSADLMERNLDRRVEVLCPCWTRRCARTCATPSSRSTSPTPRARGRWTRPAPTAHLTDLRRLVSTPSRRCWRATPSSTSAIESSAARLSPWCRRYAKHPRRDVREVGEEPVDAEVAELLELRLRPSLVAGRQELLVDAERPHVHQQTGRMRPRDEIGRLPRLPSGAHRHDQPLLGTDAVGIRRDVFQSRGVERRRRAHELNEGGPSSSPQRGAGCRSRTTG
jgi:hypothetical protein